MAEEQQTSSAEQGSAPAQGRSPHLKPYRFKKGQSGNPGGRKKGSSITARLRAVLETEHNGKQLYDLLAERIVKEALSGKAPFVKELLDRIEGKVTEKVQLEGQGYSKLVFNIVEVPAGRPPDLPALPEHHHGEQQPDRP